MSGGGVVDIGERCLFRKTNFFLGDFAVMAEILLINLNETVLALVFDDAVELSNVSSIIAVS